MKVALICVPKNAIKIGWTGACRITVAGGVAVDSDGWEMINARSKESRGSTLGRVAHHLEHGHHTARVITNALFIEFYKAGRLPTDCSGILLGLDEGHHLRDNALWEAVQEFQKRGGRYLPITASPTNDMKLPDNVIPAYVSYAEHSQGGLYAPERVEIQTVFLDGTATSPDQLLGDDLMDIDPEAYAKGVVDHYEEMGSQKYIHYLPMYDRNVRAAVYAKVLQAEFEKRGYRVFNAVGADQKTADALDKMLALEDKLRQAGKPSEYDVLLSAKRLEEGVNWPPCRVQRNSPTLARNPTRRTRRTAQDRHRRPVQGSP